MGFIVDAADRTRFQEAREELQYLLDDPCMRDVPIVVMGNKIDIAVAASEQELRDGLGLYQHMTVGKESAAVQKGAARPVELFMVSVHKRSGYGEALKWLADYLK